MPGNDKNWSVTEILKAAGLAPDYRGVNRDVLAWASQRGQALNIAIDLYEEGDLDEGSLHPEIRSAFECYLGFKKISGYEPIEHQAELIHPQWGYLAHPDAIGWIKGKRVCIDWKFVASFDHNYVSFQVAGYRLAWNAVRSNEQILPEDSYGLQFHKDGTWKLHPLKHPHAEQVFLAAVITTQERIRSGKLTRADLQEAA